jgi:hypothetical protein
MENSIIKFHSAHPANRNQPDYRPSPAKNNIPQWFLDKDKHKKVNGQYILEFANINGKAVVNRLPSWKSCPAILDIFISGYYVYTPCDITVIDNHHQCDFHGEVDVEFDEQWGKSEIGSAFCAFRGIEEGFPAPEGFYEHTFAWRPNWFWQVPEGYTTLVIHPMNRSDLPFQTVSGFIDAENKMVGSGQIPFFIKKGWRGTIPAGTPFAQIIPIKNESWTSETIDYSDEEIKEFLKEKYDTYMIGHGLTKYKETDWIKKDYE